MSVDIKIHDVKGKNYRCAIPKLNKEIVPEKCKVVVKPKKIVITLCKASKGSWLDLHYKEDKVIVMPSWFLFFCSLYFLEALRTFNFHDKKIYLRINYHSYDGLDGKNSCL